MKFPIPRPVEQLHGPATALRIRPRSKGNFTQTCNHVYAEAHGFGLVMDIFAPASPTGLAIVDVVSGAWHSDRIRLNEHIGLGAIDALCDAGFTVFAVSPGSVVKFTGFDMIEHIHAAIRYIKTHATAFQIRTGSMGILGASAGGHLAALAALQPQEALPNARDPFLQVNTHMQAMALYFPPTDLLNFDGKRFNIAESSGMPIGGLLFSEGAHHHTDAEIDEKARALSPVHYVHPRMPPTLLIHGTADTVVPLQQSNLFEARILSAGARVERITREGGGHPWPDVAPENQQMAQWFLRQLG
ncbi:MAG: prolyl oligopeptidase family serine peptidase [Candidatus Hydrogenedentes bacterium]|nr:prolyl oligopeptidase family serine peptidase [Candidatus Hydrogenedentota bacterium]